MASTTLLIAVPAAAPTAHRRSIGQDHVANRRAPPTGTLNMVFGAPRGRVSRCSRSPRYAIFTAAGPRPATSLINPVTSLADRAAAPSTESGNSDPRSGTVITPGLQGAGQSRAAGSADRV